MRDKFNDTLENDRQKHAIELTRTWKRCQSMGECVIERRS